MKTMRCFAIVAALGLAACADTAADRTVSLDRAGVDRASCDGYAFMDTDDDGLLDAGELGFPSGGIDGGGWGDNWGGALFPTTDVSGFYDCVDYEGGTGFVDDGVETWAEDEPAQ